MLGILTGQKIMPPEGGEPKHTHFFPGESITRDLDPSIHILLANGQTPLPRPLPRPDYPDKYIFFFWMGDRVRRSSGRFK
jgi:hypothetical protein